MTSEGRALQKKRTITSRSTHTSSRNCSSSRKSRSILTTKTTITDIWTCNTAQRQFSKVGAEVVLPRHNIIDAEVFCRNTTSIHNNKGTIPSQAQGFYVLQPNPSSMITTAIQKRHEAEKLNTFSIFRRDGGVPKSQNRTGPFVKEMNVRLQDSQCFNFT